MSIEKKYLINDSERKEEFFDLPSNESALLLAIMNIMNDHLAKKEIALQTQTDISKIKVLEPSQNDINKAIGFITINNKKFKISIS